MRALHSGRPPDPPSGALPLLVLFWFALVGAPWSRWLMGKCPDRVTAGLSGTLGCPAALAAPRQPQPPRNLPRARLAPAHSQACSSIPSLACSHRAALCRMPAPHNAGTAGRQCHKVDSSRAAAGAAAAATSTLAAGRTRRHPVGPGAPPIQAAWSGRLRGRHGKARCQGGGPASAAASWLLAAAGDAAHSDRRGASRALGLGG